MCWSIFTSCLAPCQPSPRSHRWAACPWRCSHRRTGLLFSDSASPWQPPEQTLWRTRSPWHIQTLPGVRSMATQGTWRPWSCCFKISCKMWLMWNTIIPSTLLLHSNIDSSSPTGSEEQKVWKKIHTHQKVTAKLTFQNVLFFFSNWNKKMLKKHTGIIMKNKLLLIPFMITIMFCTGLILHFPNAGLYFS